MPKSKRAKVVHLSKVTKKGKELTLKTFANVQESVSAYPYLYVFTVNNMRNTYLKEVRTTLSDSRLFFGKTKVMAKALGQDAATEPAPGTSALAPHLVGDVGLLFTPRDPEAVKDFFYKFRPSDFARAGTVAKRGFTLPEGTLYSRGGELPREEDVPLAHTMDPALRKLGVPCRLVKGMVKLDQEHVVCSEGDVLNSGQTALLKMFGVAIAEFAVELKACWSRETGEVISMGQQAEGKMDVDDQVEGSKV